MDKIANYIIFHPKRQSVKASATVLHRNGTINKDWEGTIFVDSVFSGNEDPFVFNNPWLYSYCHSSQLRRNSKNTPYLQPGSKLIFVDGEEADKGNFVVDTVFIVKDSLLWGKSLGPIQYLPTKYADIMNNESSELWDRHFKFPFIPPYAHKNVTHSYEADLWDDKKEIYSFLPLNSEGAVLSLSLLSLPISVQNLVEKKRRGKFPILIESDIINEIITMINTAVDIKVVKDIKLQDFEFTKSKHCGGC